MHFTSAKGGWGLKAGSVAAMFEQCRHVVVEEHLPLLVFPEGTRDGSLTLKEFKKGMFTFAVEHRCHVLVMAMDGPQRCWPFPGPWFAAGTCNVAFGALLPPADSAEQLIEDARAEMQRLLQQITGAPLKAASPKTTTSPSAAGSTAPDTTGIATQ